MLKKSQNVLGVLGVQPFNRVDLAMIFAVAKGQLFEPATRRGYFAIMHLWNVIDLDRVIGCFGVVVSQENELFVCHHKHSQNMGHPRHSKRGPAHQSDLGFGRIVVRTLDPLDCIEQLWLEQGLSTQDVLVLRRQKGQTNVLSQIYAMIL